MSRGPLLCAGATLAFALASAGSYAGPGLAGPLLSCLLLLAVAAAALGSGRRAAARLGFRGETAAESAVVGMTLGLGLLSLGVLALAVLGLLRPWAAAALLALLFLWGTPELRQSCEDLSPGTFWREQPASAAALAAGLGLVFWFCWVPPHQYDSLVYHLALPQAYVSAGRLVSPEWLLYSHFPQNGEMLFTLALLLGSDVLGQLLMGLCLLVSAGWVWVEGRRRFAPEAAGLSAVLLATHTAAMLLATTTYVEPLVMLWVSASALCFLRHREGEGRSWLVLSGVFCGLALGAKYYAGIAAALIALLLAWDAGRGRGRARDALVFCALAGALFSPWLVKNWLVVGNPVFPFFYQFFPLTETGWSAETARRYFEVFTEYGHRGKLIKDLLSLPFLLLRNSLLYGGGMDVLGDLGWELSVWCLPLGAWAARRSGEAGRRAGALGIFCGLYLMAWFLTGTVLRFLVAIAPLLALWAGFGLWRLWEALSRGGRALLACGVAVLTATHLFLFLYVQGVFGAERYLLALEGRSEFLSKRLDYYPCAAFARERLPGNDKILIVGEQRSYYVTQEHAASTVHAPNRFISWANGAADSAGLARKIAAEGFRHILLVPNESKRLGAALGAFSDKGYANWLGLRPGHLELAHEAPACAVFTVR